MPFDRAALAQTVTLADGGWSTQLVARGFPSQAMAETANLTHPKLVVELARAYLDAGAQFITTNTFAANGWNLARRKSPHDVAEVNRQGAVLVKEAIGERAALAAGSIGPSGKILAVREAKEGDLQRQIGRAHV